MENNEVYRPPHMPSSRYASNGRMQGISAQENGVIVQAIAYKIRDWNKAIHEFLKDFNPYRLQAAVHLMLVTATKLRKAADCVIRLVECNYRIALGMKAIDGNTSEAEMVYLAIMKEHGTDLKAEVKIGMNNVASKTEESMKHLEEMLERSRVREQTERKLSGERMSMDEEDIYAWF